MEREGNERDGDGLKGKGGGTGLEGRMRKDEEGSALVASLVFDRLANSDKDDVTGCVYSMQRKVRALCTV